MTAVDSSPVVHTEQGPGFTVPLAELTSALTVLSTAVASRPALPILGGVLLTRDSDGLRLRTFDYETSVTVRLDHQPGEPCTALVSLAELRKVVKAATKGDTARTTATWPVTLSTTVRHGVRLEHRDAEYSYASGARTTTREAGKYPVDFRAAEAELTVDGFTVPLGTLDDREYPTLPEPGLEAFIVDRDQLLEQLARTTVAAGKDITLPTLMTVRFELDGGALTLACTDRFRLAVTTTSVRTDLASGAWNVPAAAFTALLKALPAGPVSVGLPELGDSESWVTLRSGDVIATTRLSDAEFPKWRQLMRREHVLVVQVDRAALAKSVGKAIALGAALTDSYNYLQLEVTGDSVTVAPYVSEATHRVRGQKLSAVVEGEGIRVGMTGQYLLEALQTFAEPTVCLGFALPDKPVLMAGNAMDLTTHDAAHRHLIMPVRLAEST